MKKKHDNFITTEIPDWYIYEKNNKSYYYWYEPIRFMGWWTTT